jgi:hypothetical protein
MSDDPIEQIVREVLDSDVPREFLPTVVAAIVWARFNVWPKETGSNEPPPNPPRQDSADIFE